ncbi:MAG: YdeI/OmpD-associated family protein [Bacteroidota bacterium]|nr:YdeI/OmpD-associated family protein [Bacteroidota bacterium]
MPKDLPVILFENKEQFAEWLESIPGDDGIWIQFAKKDSGVQTLTYEEAVEVALCYGWIDGQKKKYDHLTYILRFTPRRAKSGWSLRNKEKALQLIEEGKIRPSGLAAIEQAKQNGTWDNAYEPQSTIAIPPDLEAELVQCPEARQFFESLNSVNRYAILHRIQTAKSPELRTKKIEQFMEMLINKKKIY